MTRYRVGIDVGGTFTDVVMLNEESGDIDLVKVPTTPSDPSVGPLSGLERAMTGTNVDPENVVFVVHGTTIATNSIVTGGGGRAGLIASDGFRDVLEIARQARPSLYDVFYEKPASLIPRHLCIGVPERVDARGNVLVPLDEEAVTAAGRALAAEGVAAIVVCFLHSYRNPSHERRAGELLAEVCPDVAVCLSSDICPEYREYWRANTTAVNAVLLPVVGEYLRRLASGLKEKGVASDLYLMTSSGGIISSAVASHRPVNLIESGPAAGVIAAAELASNAGLTDIISLDIGGTTAKAALIRDGRIAVTNDFEVGSMSLGTSTRTRGRGYPIKVPVIDLVEIGSGGGSIGWVDPGGALSVGPTSAGADPGPACYGIGGSEPTLTDAQVVLGRIDPDFFLGGEQSLFYELAENAIMEKIARPLQMDLEAAAIGMIEIASAKMKGVLELVSVQKGIDPRAFTLVAFGGSGPLYAAHLAGALSINRILIPPAPGVVSAWGLLSTDISHSFSRSHVADLDGVDTEFLDVAYAEFRDAASKMLLEEGVDPCGAEYIEHVDVRYKGQSYELIIPYPGAEGPAAFRRVITDTFVAAHERAYGFAVRDEPIEIVNLRMEARGAVPRPQTREVPARPGGPDRALKRIRRVFFASGESECPIYDRYLLGADDVIQGPAVIEERDSTTLLPAGFSLNVDRVGNLMVERA